MRNLRTAPRRLLGVATVALGALTLSGCDPLGSELYDAACANSIVTSSPGSLATPPINEASGLVAGRKNVGTWYAHNDSGDSARFFALTATGAMRATFNVTNAVANDWEDIAIGPATTEGRRIFLGDIGDNTATRPSIKIYRLTEPDLPPTNSAVGVTADVLTLVYPDGPRDAEAMFVHAGTGQLFIIDKRLSGGRANVYRAPANLADGSTTTLTKSGTVTMPSGLPGAITGADMSKDKTLIAVRSYGYVRLFNATGKTVANAFRGTGCNAPTPVEGQGEAIGIAADNSHIWTVSEGGTQPIHQFDT